MVKEFVPELPEKKNLKTEYDSAFKVKQHNLLDELKPKQPVVTRAEFEERLNDNFNEILEAVKSELDIRQESNLEFIRRIVREEILISQSPLKEQEEFLNVIKELKKFLMDSSLPNPEIYLKDLDSQKLINVIIDDSEKYLDYLDVFSEIVINIYSKYNLDLEILLFERGEIKIPFNEQGFKKIKITESG